MIKAFYESCRSIVRISTELTKLFNIRFGLKQGCITSWLLNMLMDGVVSGMRREGKGARLRNLKCEWEINVL